MLFVLVFLSFSLRSLDSRPLITQDLVDRINNDPRSTFKARLHPFFSNMTIGEMKRFLGPVRNAPARHGTMRPVGANESAYTDQRFIVGLDNPDQRPTSGVLTPIVYNNVDFCSSWAPAVTSAMSLSLGVHSKKFVNLSIQFIIDCDIIGDPCMERPPLSAYEQFWKRYIPQAQRWDQPQLKNGRTNFLRIPPSQLTQETCDSKSFNDCFPGWDYCPKNRVLSGTCEPGGDDSDCPIYFLYNWRWIKSHLWEVGAVTSTVVVRQGLFAYDTGIYSSVGTADEGSMIASEQGQILGMLDVTIIGWGQTRPVIENGPSFTGMRNRWWFVIPHLGKDFGEYCENVYTSESEREAYNCPAGERSGIMRFNRRFDDSLIETMAVGAVPFNFVPKNRN